MRKGPWAINKLGLVIYITNINMIENNKQIIKKIYKEKGKRVYYCTNFNYQIIIIIIIIIQFKLLDLSLFINRIKSNLIFYEI